MGGGISQDTRSSFSQSLPPLQSSSKDFHEENNKNTSYPYEIQLLRDEIRNKIPITLEKKYIFLLFFPPEFPIDSTTKYLNSRLNLPVIDLQGKFSEEFLNELSSNEIYLKGCLICDYSPNYAHVLALRNKLESMDAFLYLLYFDMNAETLQIALKKFDRYVHLASNRSYHLSASPPQSFLNDKTLLDDITGEILVQLPDDTLEGYREKLRNYHQQHLPIFINFFPISRIVGSGINTNEFHQSIDQVLYNIVSKNILESLQNNLSRTHISRSHSVPL